MTTKVIVNLTVALTCLYTLLRIAKVHCHEAENETFLTTRYVTILPVQISDHVFLDYVLLFVIKYSCI